VREGGAVEIIGVDIELPLYERTIPVVEFGKGVLPAMGLYIGNRAVDEGYERFIGGIVRRGRRGGGSGAELFTTGWPCVQPALTRNRPRASTARNNSGDPSITAMDFFLLKPGRFIPVCGSCGCSRSGPCPVSPLVPDDPPHARSPVGPAGRYRELTGRTA